MSSQVTICPLRSGSSGNAILIAHQSTRLLVDAGVGCRTIERAMNAVNFEAKTLTGLLVTHEHSDHISGIGVLMRRYHMPLYVCRETWNAMRHSIGSVDESTLRLIEPDHPFEIGDFFLSGFSTPHDAVAPLGFRIETPRGAVTLMTDIGHISPALIQQAAGSRVVLVEANYDPTMLMAGSYPEMLKRRVSSDNGHLSNQDCAKAVAQWIESGTERFILSHLSNENNYPELALLTVGRFLNEKNIQPHRDMMISVARRLHVSEPVCL